MIINSVSQFQSTSSEEDVVSGTPVVRWPPRTGFQSTSSEEDVVSIPAFVSSCHCSVSIHVLRRGRCVFSALVDCLTQYQVSIHVLRRGRCVSTCGVSCLISTVFQSTSSEEDVVSLPRVYCIRLYTCFNPRPPKRTLCRGASTVNVVINVFQSTSSEEDVVSSNRARVFFFQNCFNPRPPKRTLCLRSRG